MNAVESRAVVVRPGANGLTPVIACKLCGVLLWDIEAHYDFALKEEDHG